MKKVVFLIFATAFCLTINAVTRYVTTTGAGAMNGGSWANAYPGGSLQLAINNSGTGDEVWVAAGTYYTTSSTTRTISFNMKNGVSIYGSFSGNETLLSQRVISNGLTSILSAEIGTVGIGDNSYHTIHNTNLNGTAVIDGFIIRDANDNRVATNDEGLGGGIYNAGSNPGNSCSPTIRNCIITNNRAVFGAGIFNSGSLGGTSSPTIINCVITTNTATTGGGGIDNFGLGGNANPSMVNCVIYNNAAVQRAGGMYCWGGNNGNANPVVLNCTFANNSAVDGGGIVCDNLNSGAGNSGSATPIIKNSILWGNTASGIGPQFFVLGTATFNATYSDVDLTGQTAPHIVSTPTTGNINSDPLFVSIVNGAGTDGFWMTVDDALQLQNISPCKDAGNNSGVTLLDILSVNRIFNSTVDIGPYEYSVISSSLFELSYISNEITLFPNPATNFVFVNGIKDLNSKVIIMDTKGSVVATSDLENGHLNISTIAKGLYYLVFEANSGIIVKRLVKD